MAGNEHDELETLRVLVQQFKERQELLLKLLAQQELSARGADNYNRNNNLVTKHQDEMSQLKNESGDKCSEARQQQTPLCRGADYQDHVSTVSEMRKQCHGVGMLDSNVLNQVDNAVQECSTNEGSWCRSLEPTNQPCSEVSNVQHSVVCVSGYTELCQENNKQSEELSIHGVGNSEMQATDSTELAVCSQPKTSQLQVKASEQKKNRKLAEV